MHAKHIFEIFFVIWKYNMIYYYYYYYWETWLYAWKFFLMFWQKLGILILDVYLYTIKIQTNINQNEVKNLRKITDFFEIIFWRIFFSRTGPSPAHVAGLDPAGLTGSLAQASDPAGQIRSHACMQQLLFKWITIHLNTKT